MLGFKSAYGLGYFMVKIKTLLLVLLLCIPTSWIYAANGHVDIREFNVQNYGNPYQYKVNARINIALSDELRYALLNGVKLLLITRFSLGKHNEWWWDSLSPMIEIHYELKYHSLSKYYTVTDKATNQFWNFSTLPRALQHVSIISDFVLPALSDVVSNGQYYLFIESSVQPETPQLPLKIQELFDQKYIIKSEGALWALP